MASFLLLHTPMSRITNHLRYLCSELVSVDHRDEFGQTQSTIGNLEEIASTRLSLLFDSRIPLGASVVVRCQGHSLQGTVSKATEQESLGWFIDVELDRRSQWSKKMFVPSHLFAIAAHAHTHAAA